jgi:aspartyl-tRNA synthetase
VHLFKIVKGIEIPPMQRMTYAEAMEKYGNDKPDIRFGMLLNDLSNLAKGKGFKVFDEAEIVLAICVPDAAGYTRKQTDELTEWVKRPQIGMGGMAYVKYNSDGTLKSSVDKFYNEDQLKTWAVQCGAKPGDLLLILSGPEARTRKAMSELRLEMGNRLGLRKPDQYSCHWVLDFPLLEWNEDHKRWHAMHHPFTSPLPEDAGLLESNPGKVRANAYDMVINGVEVGGGSIRIHNRDLQQKMFAVLGFTPEQYREQFGFLLNAFEYGAPPHGGIAFGFDRLCALFGGQEVIRDFIAFPKNNSGRDVMIDAPSALEEEQLKELGIRLNS